MSPEPARRLPVWAVVRRSYAFAWESRGVLAVPYLVYAFATLVAELLVGAADPGAGNPAALVLLVIEEIFGMAFAVGIHRFVLMGEARRGLAFFRWDQNFLLYLMNALLLVMMGSLIGTILTALLHDLAGALGWLTPTGEPADLDLFRLALAMAVAPAAVLMVRLALILPASAIGGSDRLRTAWQATEGNGFRLFLTAILVLAPFFAVEGAILRWTPDGGFAFRAATTIVLGLVSPVQLVVATTMLALNYDCLVRGGGPGR